MSRINRVGCWFLVLAGLAAWSGCSSHPDVWKDLGGPPRVVVTFAPLASWVKAIGGEHVGVICLCTTQGPHEYQYSTKESIGVREANLLLAIGLGLDDSFADKLNRSASNKNLRYVKLGEQLPKELKLKAEEEDPGEKGKDHGEHEHQGEWDPHVWLGLDTAPLMAAMIRDELVKIDPKNKADYDRNYDALKTAMVKLGTEAGQVLGGKTMRLVTFHDSMRYFARGVKGLEIVDTIENGPGNDPNAKRFTKLIEECKEKNYHFIAKEPQYSAQAVDTLRNALKKEKLEVTVFTFDPLETANPAELDADWYVKNMANNLHILKEAMTPPAEEKAEK